MSAAPHLRPQTVSLRRERVYLGVRSRLLVRVLAGLVWAAFTLWLSLPWIAELGEALTLPVAFVVVFATATVPGYLAVGVAASLLLDRTPPLRLEGPFPAVSLLVVARDDEARIEETLTHALRQEYPGGLEVVVADAGSTDSTAEIVRARAGRDPRVRLLEAQGATEALHGGLEAATAPLIAIVDADAFLLPFALRRAVGRLMAAPASTFAVTGGLLVRNPRSRAVAWLLRWDRVTPGGFLVCERDVLRAAGGQLQGSGTFEPTALGLADNPVSFRTFRSGTGPFFRYLDGVFGCTFLPGALLALTGRFALVGPVTLAVLPLAALAAGAMFAHRRSAFAEVGLRTGRSILGFGAYIALYPFVLAHISFAGYVKGLAGARRAR